MEMEGWMMEAGDAGNRSALFHLAMKFVPRGANESVKGRRNMKLLQWRPNKGRLGGRAHTCRTGVNHQSSSDSI